MRAELGQTELEEVECSIMDGPAPSGSLRDADEEAVSTWAEVLAECSQDPAWLEMATTLLFVVRKRKARVTSTRA